MNYSFHPQAQVEFEQAIEYYEDCQDGLGYEFAIEIHDTIQNIVNFPCTWPELQSGIRRCLARRFPYGVLYFMEQGDILILAVMHLHRSPDYWKSRIQ
jgi:plasmid stabilization system protein ParE